MTILAAGTVLWRPGCAEPEIALVHRPRYDDWSLPKGKVDPGEHLLTTAVRETFEETGFAGDLGAFLGEVRYDTDAGPKVVSYWAMRASDGTFTAGAEVDALRWLPGTEALGALSRPADRAPVAALLGSPLPTTTVLLVRHGHAGSRAEWDGPDGLRPLNELGRREAAVIAAALPAYRPASVWSAGLVRCTQTVRPLADALGLPVQVLPAVSDAAWAAEPDRAVAAVCALAGSGRPVVVCSQGGAIPGLLDALADERTSGRRHDVPRKGSVWALSFAAGRLTAADYREALWPVR